MSKKRQTSSLKEDFISRLSNKKKHAVALVFLFILPLILYSAIFFGGQQFMGNDVTQWRASAQSVIEHIDQHDEHPLWVTNMFSGMPSYVVHNPSSPPNIDLLIKKVSGSVQPLLYFWVLLGGVYLFFMMQGIRPFSSAIGSIFIGFTTYLPIIIEAGHYNKFVAFALIPWMFVGYLMVSRSDKKLLAFFTFALALTLQLRANHPQVLYYFLYLLGFWWIYDSWFAYKKDEVWEWLNRTGIAFGAGILAIICSIDVFWRLYEYAEYSTRGGSTLKTAGGGSGGLSLDYAFSWSQGVGELFTLIIPGLYGGSSVEAYWGPKTFTSGPHYLGGIAFLLALIGLFRYRKKIKYLFFGVGSLTTLFALGENFRLLNEFMFHFMPFFNKFRTPEMWLIVTVFCFSVLAAYGVEAIFDIAKDRRKSISDLFLPLGVALVLGVVFSLGSSALLSFEKPGEAQQISQQLARQNSISPDNPQVQQKVRSYINNQLKPERKEMASSDSIRYLILALLVSGLVVGLIKRKVSKGYFLVGLMLLAAYDMLSVDSRYVNENQMVPDYIEAEQQIQQQKQPMDDFVIQNIESGEGYQWRVFPLMRSPFNNAVPMSYFYPTVGGYTGAKLAHYQDLIDHLLMQGPSGINEPILDMLNVKYLTAHQQLPFDGYTEVFNQGNQYVYENNDVLPKAFFVDSIVTVTTPHEAVDLMQPSADFDPATTAIVETNQSITASADTTAKVTVEAYKGNEIRLQTSSPEDGFLVISEIYYPEGWEAEIDGEPTQIHKTNFVLRGLEVPAGDHTITMSFEPASHVWGMRIAWFGHIILWISGIGAVTILWKQRSSNKDEESVK